MTSLAAVADAVDLAEEWEPPHDLWGASITAPPLPRGIFPPKIDDFLFSAENIHSPLASAVSLMFAAATIIGGRRYVNILDDWNENLIFWLAIHGSSSAGKSPAMHRALTPLFSIQSANAATFSREMAEWRENGEPANEEPRFVQYYCNDGTIEAVSTLLSRHNFGVGLFADELSDFISRFINNQKEALANSGAWLTAYTGKPFFVNRVKRGDVFCPYFAVSILGAITTDKLLKTMRRMPADGFTSRMVYIHVPELPPAELKSVPQEIIDGYGTVLLRLNDLRVLSAAPEPLRFDKEAAAAFSDIRIGYMHRARMHQDHRPRLAEWEGKLPGLLARVAGLLYMLEGAAEVRIIQLQTLRRAEQLVSLLSAHARVFFDALAGEPDGMELKVARAIGNYILRSELPVIRVGDITRHVVEWGDALTTRTVKISTIEMLENLGWIRCDEDWLRGGQMIKGAKFQINPQVHDIYRRRAEEVKHFAAEAVESIKKSAAERREKTQ